MAHWYDMVAARMRENGVSRVEAGKRMTPPISGQAITLKLQGKRPVSVDELQVLSRLAGMTVAEALGDDVVIELQEEKDLVELFRILNDGQKSAFIALLRASAVAK